MAQRRNMWTNCLQREWPTISLTPVHTHCSFHQAVMVHPLSLDLPSDLLSSIVWRWRDVVGPLSPDLERSCRLFFFFFLAILKTGCHLQKSHGSCKMRDSKERERGPDGLQPFQPVLLRQQTSEWGHLGLSSRLYVEQKYCPDEPSLSSEP